MRVHGRHPEDLPEVLKRFRKYHREELIQVNQTADEWEIRCDWWHRFDPDEGALTCVPPREGS